MNCDKSYICTKHFVEKQPQEKKQRLLSYLSTSGREAYEKVPRLQETPIKSLSLHELLGKIHPSHFIEAFSNLPHDIKLSYISALPSHVRREVSTSLSINEPSYDFEEKLRDMFCNEIISLLTKGKSGILPLSYIPDDPLLCLAKCDSIELSTLVSFLGLFDLIGELKTLINGKLLLKLEESLSDDELKILRNIEGWKRKKVLFESIGLDRWNGDASILRMVIKERGINRLAKAMNGSGSDLVWLVEHIMDAKMKSEFCKYRAEMGDRTLVEVLIEQVLFCWDKICIVSH